MNANQISVHFKEMVVESAHAAAPKQFNKKNTKLVKPF